MKPTAKVSANSTTKSPNSARPILVFSRSNSGPCSAHQSSGSTASATNSNAR